MIHHLGLKLQNLEKLILTSGSFSLKATYNSLKLPHPEHDDGYCRPVRIQYEPWSFGDLDATLTQDDLQAVAQASDGTASVSTNKISDNFETNSSVKTMFHYRYSSYIKHK